MLNSPVLAASFFLLQYLNVALAVASEPFEFERSFKFEGIGCSSLQWSVDQEALKITIQWKSEPGSEWTAFGISENGGMKGADIAMVKLDGDASFAVEDQHSSQFELPSLDLLSNVELLDAEYDEEGRLQVTIQRDLDTCDSQDIAVKPHKQYLICASGQLSEDGTTAFYHGPHRVTGLVNLMVDEELLFERQLVPPSPNASKVYLGEGITTYVDVETALAPFPVDIQMPNISLDSSVSTHYRCRVFNVSKPMKFTAFEGVWGDGATASSGPENDALHHTFIYSCKHPTEYVTSHIDGKPWDCLSQMPVCDLVASYARGTGLTEIPAGLHFPLDTGVHVLLVHYENPYGKAIENDQSGFRLWVEPPAIKSTSTKAAQIVANDALFESLQIPADPEQKELTLQYLISAEATREFLPKGGVQAFGSVLHMHKLGVRGKVELIRNGTHIMDVYNHKSYDFDRQSADFQRWRFLPGDALIVSCTFKPETDRTVVGGYRSSDEMCPFYVAWSPAIPNYGRAMGVFVKEGEPFLNTHMGNNITVYPRSLDYSQYKYAPSLKSSNDYVKLTDHRKNTCKTFIREELAINAITYADPAIFAQIIAIIAFVVVSSFANRRVLRYLGIRCGNIRDQRNAVVYMGQLLFSTVVLPYLCWDLASIFQEKETFDAVDSNQHVLSRGIMMTQAVLYLLELFYRIDVRWSLMVHHLTTSFTVIYFNVVLIQSYQHLVLKFGIGLTLLAVTEQPLYILLLLKLKGFRETLSSRMWRLICHIACSVFVVTRLIVVVLMLVLLVQQSGSSDIAWSFLETSFGEWHTPPSVFTGNPRFVNAMLVILLSGILFSNFFAVKAMLHMSQPPVVVDQEEEESKQQVAERTEEQDEISSDGLP